jgi:hypothetical protein
VSSVDHSRRSALSNEPGVDHAAVARACQSATGGTGTHSQNSQVADFTRRLVGPGPPPDVNVAETAAAVAAAGKSCAGISANGDEHGCYIAMYSLQLAAPYHAVLHGVVRLPAELDHANMMAVEE